MNILVTNDDGVLAPGLALLADVCRDVGEVTVVAPDREQSGTSHSLTLHRPLRPTRRPDGAYQIDGTPTDCVMLALGALMAARPDFVFSGVNHGPNMGEDVLYSGTVAAAMEAVMLGVPGVAISFAGHQPETMATYRDVLRDEVLPQARSWVMIEQVAGLLYVALVISRIVGLTIARVRGNPGD